MPGIPMKQDDGGPIPAEWKLSCVECGYELTGLLNRICPECGTLFSPRKTWEANQAGTVAPEKVRAAWLTRILVVGGVVATILLIGRLTQHAFAGGLAAFFVVLGEAWIHFSAIRPALARIIIACLCIIVLMFVVL